MAPANSSNPLFVLWEVRVATEAAATAGRDKQQTEEENKISDPSLQTSIGFFYTRPPQE